MLSKCLLKAYNIWVSRDLKVVSTLMPSCKLRPREVKPEAVADPDPDAKLSCVLPMAPASLPCSWVFWKADKQALFNFYVAMNIFQSLIYRKLPSLSPALPFPHYSEVI